MMLFQSTRPRKLVIGLMVAVMGARMVIFASAALGVTSWGGSKSGASWIALIMLPMLVILVMLLLGRGGMMRHAVMGGPQETPLELLQKRFVRGELTKDEYEEMKHALLDGAPSSCLQDEEWRESPEPGPSLLKDRAQLLDRSHRVAVTSQTWIGPPSPT